MVKRVQRKKTNEETKGKTAALILLVIMIFSIAGFAMIGSNYSGNSNDDTRNIPFQQFQYQGQTFYGAVINGEEFVFQTIDGFDQREDIAQIANQIKQASSLQTYVTSEYTDANGPFILEQKYSAAYSIPVTRIQNLSCETPTVVFTTNNSTEEIPEQCIVFKPMPGEEAQDALILSYYLIQN
jgi:hypothetical protein